MNYKGLVHLAAGSVLRTKHTWLSHMESLSKIIRQIRFIDVTWFLLDLHCEDRLQVVE